MGTFCMGSFIFFSRLRPCWKEGQLNTILSLQHLIIPVNEPTPYLRMTASKQSGLIVNFPMQLGQPAVEKAVHFSPTSEVKMFEKSSRRENKEKWYTGEEYRLFKCQRNRDLIHCSNVMMFKSDVGEGFTTEDMAKFTGLEFVLSRDLPNRMREIVNKREEHAALILAAQAHLRSANLSISSATALARVSEKSSHHERKMSHKVAAASFGVTD